MGRVFVDNEPMRDAHLMRRVRDHDDIDAFALIVARYRPQLTRFFAALLPAGAPADDFSQETLLTLWRIRGRWTPSGAFSAFVFQIARGHYLNHRVRLQRLAQRLPLDDGDTLILRAPSATQPETVALEHAEQTRRREAINCLPERCRIVFVLHHIDGLPYSIIADQLQIPIGTVKSRMHDAIRHLRSTLSTND